MEYEVFLGCNCVGIFIVACIFAYHFLSSELPVEFLKKTENE